MASADAPPGAETVAFPGCGCVLAAADVLSALSAASPTAVFALRCGRSSCSRRIHIARHDREEAVSALRAALLGLPPPYAAPAWEAFDASYREVADHVATLQRGRGLPDRTAGSHTTDVPGERVAVAPVSSAAVPASIRRPVLPPAYAEADACDPVGPPPVRLGPGALAPPPDVVGKGKEVVDEEDVDLPAVELPVYTPPAGPKIHIGVPVSSPAVGKGKDEEWDDDGVMALATATGPVWVDGRVAQLLEMGFDYDGVLAATDEAVARCGQVAPALETMITFLTTGVWAEAPAGLEAPDYEAAPPYTPP
ncbi:uncharacterized protein AMSG_05448 [Thecamonas trahens ATCC 50062]|uniref:Uncharacterized protein n=1 Tax=Thecamonas trahens ATCC 50062 TaxID=461836 RepID=A0A0L0DBF0_THETB|nr:hypothetical protein AMSG_05448 [Thecamonas trahens ATCC 50062]KNC49441.1 hypothetical protein AMSG_05448 [Thecamonas trahens ATCC 50062]|eukprot:XP_013757863.1 hypothetical protein AMSG_05448 [Thecamonas trahens ATCC 50062]